MIGIFLLVVGILFLYYLLAGVYDKNGFLFLHYNKDHAQNIKWWHYITGILIVGLGIIFMYSGKINYVEVNLDEKVIRKISKSIFCR